MKNNTINTLIIAAVVGAASFWGGMKYQQNNAVRNFPSGQAALGNGQFAGRFAGNGGRTGQARGSFRPVSGEIISADDKSITVKLQDGSSKIVFFDSKTEVSKADKVDVMTLKTGDKVAVFGMENKDGSVTAQNIQLNPIINFRGQAPNTSQKSSDAREVVVTGSNYKFTPDKITVKKGQKTRIIFKNAGGMHDFKIDELKVSTAIITDGAEDFVEFTPDKTGTFEFYCSVGNHRQMGMKGSITVE